MLFTKSHVCADCHAFLSSEHTRATSLFLPERPFCHTIELQPQEVIRSPPKDSLFHCVSVRGMGIMEKSGGACFVELLCVCAFFCKLKKVPSYKAIKSAVEGGHLFKPLIHYRDRHLRNFELHLAWLFWNLNKKDFVTELTRAVLKASLILIVISN